VSLEEKPVRFERPMRRGIAVTALGALFLLAGAMVPEFAVAQGELTRKVKTKVSPTYPELARRMSIHGTVKMIVVVSADGSLKNTKVVGGNPILVNAALDALRKWKFEPGQDESTGTLEFEFQPKRTAE
jgi:TonB family protein